MWFAFFGCGVDIETSDYRVKIKRTEGSILREISVNHHHYRYWSFSQAS